MLFRKTDFFMELQGGKNLLLFFATFVGVNGFVEAVSCFVIATAVAKALITINKRMHIK